MKQREVWLDALRGLAIVSTVFCHIALLFCEYGTLFSFPIFLIETFQMPVFFFISGYLFKTSSNRKGLLLKKSMDYFVPTLLLGTGLFLIYFICADKIDDFNTLIAIAIRCLNDAWFLLVLWLVSVITVIIYGRKINMRVVLVVSCIFTFSFGFFSAFISKLCLYFMIFIYGLSLQKKQIKFSKMKFGLMLFAYISLSLYVYIGTQTHVLANPIYKAVLSMLSCELLIDIFRKVREQNRFLTLCGRYSLDIYVIHMWIYVLLAQIVDTVEPAFRGAIELQVIVITMVILAFILVISKKLDTCILGKVFRKPSAFFEYY